MIDHLTHLGLLNQSSSPAFYRRGHFRYESGDHGDTWLILELIFTDQVRLQHAAAQLAERIRPRAPELICGPLVGGALLGQWVAHALDIPFVYAESRSPDEDGKPNYIVPDALRPLVPGKRVVIVDDVINAGAATLAALREVHAQGGHTAGVACLIARVPGAVDLWAERGIALDYLIPGQWNTWPPDSCPLCRAGVPLDPLP